MIELAIPSLDRLPQYKAALEKGWSPDNVRLAEAAREELEQIKENPTLFIDQQTDLDAKAGPITLPDGSQVARLPGFRRWIWDGEFCGSIGFRWQSGTSALPSYVLGHVGYAVVPWKRQRGCATQALKLLLTEARNVGLSYIEITADPDNIPSQKVITSNGGVLVHRFKKQEAYGGGDSLLFRIDLISGDA